MKGMNLQEQKKCGILVTAIGLVMFAIGFLLGDVHMGDFYSGLGCGLFVCGAVRRACLPPEPRPEKATDYDASSRTSARCMLRTRRAAWRFSSASMPSSRRDCLRF